MRSKIALFCAASVLVAGLTGGLFSIVGPHAGNDLFFGSWVISPDTCQSSNTRISFNGKSITMTNGKTEMPFGRDYKVSESGGLIDLNFTFEKENTPVLWQFARVDEKTLQMTTEYGDAATEKQINILNSMKIEIC